MPDILATENNFRSLSIKDLLAARDQYHYHLMNKTNVVGTAIGLYLIRKEDRDPPEERMAQRVKGIVSTPRDKGERTFANSETRDYSWPCVIALVKEWLSPAAFGGAPGQYHPEEMVPKTLYMPDGRMVPVCVVKVEQGAPDPRPLPAWHWPDGTFAAGMPILVETQERERQATAGCLVTDGHTTYALTSRHVCGASGEPVYTIAGGRRVQIGMASPKHLSRLPFTDIYPEYAGRRTYSNLDVGLIQLSNVNDWTSQPIGLGSTGGLADLNELNITLRLINAPVVAAGASSGRLEGHIKALFYRYKTVGGYDYVSDFLIAPRALADGASLLPERTRQTQPGDSGAVWHLVVQEEGAGTAGDDTEFEGGLRPLAVQWGGQVFLEGPDEKNFAFALATSLTTVCKELDVELVIEHNIGVMPYWGQVGHYSIAAFACQALTAGNLQTFMSANLDRVSFEIAELTPKEISDRLKQAKADGDFVPLADVPDIIWKQHKSKIEGGRDTQFLDMGRTTGPEHPTHYADIDEPGKDGKTLLELCLEDDENISVGVWRQFYDDADHKTQHERGLLPFRVWQFFDAMEEFARNEQTAEFLCAAGLVSHYVGDACQPLHGSMLADGFKDQPVTETHHHENGDPFTKESHVGAGVHSTYETKMIDRHAPELIAGLQQAFQGQQPPMAAIHSGKEAAEAIIALMDRSAHSVPPKDLVDTYVAAGGKPNAAERDKLWEKFGDKTIEVMADGARVLAAIWQGAWSAGNGGGIAASKLGTISTTRLMPLYRDPKFVESLDIDSIGPVLHQPATA